MVAWVSPKVLLISRPVLDRVNVQEYIDDVGGTPWWERVVQDVLVEEENLDGEVLVEFAGRTCYRSWAPGLNKNVTRVREDSSAYLGNVIASLHGSVTEHAFYVFAIENCSRVFTHELVRHRAGTSISQESLRYVRLEDLSFWLPDWVYEDKELLDECYDYLVEAEKFQKFLADHFGLDDMDSFHDKKVKTSFMRRFAPDGLATTIVWGANARALRHVIEMRTDPSAEEEIRLIFDQIANIMKIEMPALFADFTRLEDGTWRSEHRKV